MTWVNAKQYDRAMVAFRLASRKFRKARESYRARKISDSEFALAQSEFKAAQAIADYAETNFINANNGGA